MGNTKTILDNSPKLSIIIPTFNSGKTLESAILSIISQEIDNVEIIIIDGLSTDNTIQIIRKYEKFIGFFKSEKDNGVYEAMNKALTNTSGDYLYFMGADDLLMPNILSEVLPILKSPNTIYYGNSFFPKRDIIYDGKFHSYKIVIRNICHQAIFYPSSVFKKYIYETEYVSHADYFLNLKLWSDKQFSFEYIQRTIAIFNDYDGISKKSLDKKLEADKLSIIISNFNLPVTFYFKLRKALVSLLNMVIKRK